MQVPWLLNDFLLRNNSNEMLLYALAELDFYHFQLSTFAPSGKGDSLGIRLSK